MTQLADFGWTDDFATAWRALDQDGLQPARVIADFGTSLKVAMPEIRAAELSGKLAHTDRQAIPKVGDWVAVRVPDTGRVVIESVVPRRSEIARKVAGKQTVKQVIAANVDIAFVLLALDNDFSVERLKRFLYQLSISSISPVIVLQKADKTDDIQKYLGRLEMLQLPLIISRAFTGQGIDAIRQAIRPRATAILLGSSGVGKSTITNQLLGRDIQETSTTRTSDDTGKHTTIHRELFILPNGGLLIDTPGIRELQLWGTPDELDHNFDDIVTIISQCKYRDCQHDTESGCAVLAALADGSLSHAHYASYIKMKEELQRLAKKNALRQRYDNRRPRR
jgi:ribosome biogenesis GTPase